MPRTTSLQKALTALSDLGLIVSPISYRDRDGEVYQTIVFALSPSYFVQVATKETRKNWHRNDLPHGNTVGMGLLFDQDEKFVGGSYSNVYWDDYGDGPAGWEVRTLVSSWSPDEKTLKASLSFLREISPVGTAQAEQEAQEAAQAAEKAEQERRDNLAAVNQTVLDNPDTRGWLGAVAYEAKTARRRAITELRSLAKECSEAADRLEAEGRASRLWFHLSTATTVAQNLAKLEALEETIEGPLAEALREVSERYGY
jgi:hypothetical protein